tara:strand:+ start:27743 stop:29107 length:1365 start_codon:yes stop_codon:yes gene_type:complete
MRAAVALDARMMATSLFGARTLGGVAMPTTRKRTMTPSTVVMARAARGGGRGGRGSRGRGEGGRGGRGERDGGAATRGRGGRGGRGSSQEGRGGGGKKSASRDRGDYISLATASAPSRPIPPLVFDDSSQGSEVFLSSGDRTVTMQEQLHFERKGHVCVRDILSNDEAKGMVSDLIKETKARQLEAYRHRIAVLCPTQDPMSVHTEQEALAVLKKHSDEEVGFLQTFNLHRPNSSPPGSERKREGENTSSENLTSQALPSCAQYILSKRLAKVAAELLGAGEEDKVRVYQSCVFVKPPGFGETHWHSDANMVPLDVNKFVTLWLPLRPLHEDDAALVFASGSHRDFSLPYWKTLEGMSDLNDRGYEVESYPPLDLGDATAHAGWTLHWSPPQPNDCPPRYALSVCYFLDGARRLRKSECRQDPHSEDEWSYREWLQDIEQGAPARHPALPVVYP